MSHMFLFEKLIAWQKAKGLSIAIYSATNSFPNEEKYGLTSQLRRASVSIASNLAEGSGRQTNKDKARFSEISYSSLLELLNQVKELSRIINALRKSQLNT